MSGVEQHRAAGPGCTVWLTGLPCAGKSTLAEALAAELRREGRRVEVLDSDQVRSFLSTGLGFSRADRGLNVRRIGWVAQVLARNGVLVLVAVIAPYAEDRAVVAANHRESDLRFLEVHVAAPLPACAARDVKGLYARHAAGMLKGLTGVDDPYDPPADPDLRVDTHLLGVPESVAAVRGLLTRRGVL